MLPAQTTHSPQPLIIGVPGVPAWLSDCASGTDFTLTLTRVGSLHVTSVHRTLTGTHTCHGPKHTPPSWAQPLCSAEQLLPQGTEVRAAAALSGEQTGGGGNGGEPWKDVGTPSGPEPRSPCHEFPGSGPLAEMPTDGSMLTLPQLSASLTVKDPPPALQSRGAQTFPTLIYLPDSDTCSQTGLGPQAGTGQ